MYNRVIENPSLDDFRKAMDPGSGIICTNRNGDIVEIVTVDENKWPQSPIIAFQKGVSASSYTADGKYNLDGSKSRFDLVLFGQTPNLHKKENTFSISYVAIRSNADSVEEMVCLSDLTTTEIAEMIDMLSQEIINRGNKQDGEEKED